MANVASIFYLGRNGNIDAISQCARASTVAQLSNKKLLEFKKMYLYVLAIVIAVIGVSYYFWQARTNATFSANDRLTIKLHNHVGLSMFQLGINGIIVIARRNPSPDGKTYRIPIAKYGHIQNISLVVYGEELYVDSIRLNDTDILKSFLYTGTDIGAVLAKDIPDGTRVHNGKWDKPGVYVYIP